jgi:hypothetical protein
MAYAERKHKKTRPENQRTIASAVLAFLAVSVSE